MPNLWEEAEARAGWHALEQVMADGDGLESCVWDGACSALHQLLLHNMRQ